MKRIILLPLIILLFSQAKKEEAIYLNKIDQKLLQKLEKMADNEKIKVYIDLPNVDYSYVATLPTGDEKVEYMKNHAYSTQKPIIDYLKSKIGNIEELYQGWTANRLFAKLPKYIIFELVKKFPEIVKIYEDEYKIWIPQDYKPHILSEFYPGEDYVSGSIQNIKADEGWRRGYRGKGIIIGNMDTGVDGNHPVLKNSYRGISAWYDAVGAQSAPYDDNGHGTGTMGFLVGSHGIGAAPCAKWIAVKILDANGQGTTQNIQAGFDWVANLPDSLRPHIMSNSWGSNNTTDITFWPNIQAWLVRGIIPVFAAGNAGPNGGTAGTPGNFPMVFGIGGTWWPSEQIISYSSRGPAPNQAPWTNTAWWGRPDWNRHKPDLIAPSEPTVTAAPEGEYQDFGGTSAACPHAAGCLALLLQANNFGLVPSMAGMDTSEIRKIYKFVTGYGYGDANSYWNPAWGNPSSTPGLRDTFGWGRVDAEKWISNIPEPAIPNIFIDSVYVVSTGDGDKEIEPEENVTIAIRLKNTGANAQNVTAKIVYRTNNALNIPAIAVSYGNMQKGQSVTQNFTLSTADVLPQNTRIYLTLRINSTTGNYKKHDFFYLDTWVTPHQRLWVYYHDGSPANAYDDIYMAQRFITPANDTIISVRVMMYQGAGANCILYVWSDNNGRPGNIVYQQNFTLNNVYPDWQQIDIPAGSRPVMSGVYWIGFYTAGSGAPYSVMDGANNPSSITAYSTNGTDWSLYDAEEYMLEVYIGRTGITTPYIQYEGSCIFDDSKAGNGDGWADPGEQGGLAISLKNLGLNAYNVTGTLQAQDQFTQTYVTIIKNTASFGNAPNGNPSTNNYNDPWIIRISDDCPITGDQDFNFIVNISAQYYPAGSGTPSNYTTTINFILYSPFVPYENTVWFIPTGTGGLGYATSVSSRNRYNFADFYFGLIPLDSFFVDTLYGYYYNTDQTPDQQDVVRLYIYDHCATNPAFPGGEQIWSVDLGGNQARGWKKGIVNLKVPGFIWPGIYTGGSATDAVYPFLFGAPFVGYYIRIYSALPTGCAPGNVANGGGIPYAFYVVSHHDHPTVSYYRPPNWSWPITPTNTRNSTTIPSTLNSWPDTTFANFVIYNRSSINIAAPPTPTRKGARDVWDNYLFLDNWGQWNAQVNFALNAWNYAVAQNLELKVPGGRHTLLIGLDWNNEVGGNVLNEYLRYWGMQFSWNPRKLFARNAPKRIRWVPELTGPFAGPYYNCTAYACSVYTVNYQNGSPYGKPWHGIAIRNFNLTWNNDLDLRLYSDKPNDPYSGYTNILESSELGPNVVDFIMIDGRHVGTKYYAGVYSFIEPSGSPPDSTWMHYEAARYVITTGTRWNYVDDNFTDSTVIHVYDVIINNGQTFQCTLRVLQGTQTYFIALYGSQQEDRIKRRIDYLVSGNASPLNPAYLSYTNTGANDTFGLVIVGNLNASGMYRLKFLGTGQPLGTMEIEFSAKCIDEGILLLWGDLSDAKAISIEKANGRGYEKITELPSNSREYIDKNVENGKTYTYRLIAHYDNRDRILGPVTITYISPIPKELTILSMSRNIIKNSGFVRIAVPKKEKVDIEIYDPAGRICKKVFSGYLERGIYEFKIDIDSKGVYFLIVKDREKRIREKLLFM